MSYRKVFRSKFKAICEKCNTRFTLDLVLMKNQYIRHRNQPDCVFKASSSFSTIFCPNCNHNQFRLDFEYQNLYRRRCKKCGKMFETEESWKDKCDSCARKHVKIMVHSGPS